jgi:hypothetical protein
VSVVLIAAPFVTRVGGLKLQLDCRGSPEQANVTVGWKLASGAGVTVRLVWTLFPRATVRLGCAAVTTMSTTVRATAEEEEEVKFVSPA